MIVFDEYCGGVLPERLKSVEEECLSLGERINSLAREIDCEDDSELVSYLRERAARLVRCAETAAFLRRASESSAERFFRTKRVLRDRSEGVEAPKAGTIRRVSLRHIKDYLSEAGIWMK